MNDKKVKIAKNLWLSPEMDKYVKEVLKLDCYNCLHYCMGYILDYRATVQLIGNDFIVNSVNIQLHINADTFELKGVYC